MEKIGPYKVLGSLGHGGMGSVYRVRDTVSGEIQALKVLSETMNQEQHFRNRFESEINALIQLNHPNIVRILSFGQEMGKLYFTMELVNGNSLFQLRKKGHRFDWRQIIEIGKQVAAGLRHAHDHGIIHRDLKPGNLLMQIDENGNHQCVKITDFGIAKQFGNSLNTGHNMIGTLDFMSPEQAKGQPVTTRSDLYGLGAVMFTLLAGKPPFSSNSFEESIRNLTKVAPPSISKIVPDVPIPLDRLIRKLMAKQPENRVPTALALMHQLDEIEAELIKTSQAETFAKTAAKPESKSSKSTQSIGTQSGPRTKRADDVVTQFNDEDQKTADRIDHGSPPPANTNRPAKTKRNTRKQAHINQGPTLADDQPYRLENTTADRLTDFHSPVTEQYRKQRLVRESPKNKNQTTVIQLLAIAVALLAVIGLAFWGTMKAIQPVPADTLFAQIESKSELSHTILEPIEQFLDYYPDDSRAEQVRQWQQAGTAYRQHHGVLKKIMTRSKIRDGQNLSDLERQFVEIMNRHGDDKAVAATKLEALFNLFSAAAASDAESDQETLDTVRYFADKLNRDLNAEVAVKLEYLAEAFKSAQAENDFPRAAEKFQAIIDLYGDETWPPTQAGRNASRLIDESRKWLEEYRKEQLGLID